MTPRQPLSILKDLYGYDSFRGSQAEIIDHVIDGGSAFVLMPTGGGKSLCYQIPALCRDGLTVVVSPLIALMQDQISALEQMNIKAATINSSMSSEQVSNTYRQIQAGALNMLYVAPERLLMPEFLRLLDKCDLALFAIDEAHCVSQWGHDFRPDYAALSVLAERFAHVPRIALTATADAPTRKDIVERLGLENGRTFVSGFDRPNIHYTIALRSSPRQQVWKFIQENHANDSGIIYCISRKKVDEIAAWLSQQGVNARPYHAGLSADVRAENQREFLRGEQIIMVATIAFGMGIDKPDVRFVVHMNIPKNIEAYYQETGRAGRDGLPSNALMLYAMEDAAMQRQWIDSSDASDEQSRIQHKKLNALLGLCETATCRRQALLNYFDDSCEPCGNCDTCEKPPKTFDATVLAQKAISCAYRTGERFGVSYLTDVLVGAKNDKIRRFGHDQVSTYGIGKDLSKSEWQNIFRQLVSMNFLAPNAEGYGSLEITHTGRSFLKEKSTLSMREYVKTSETERTQRSDRKSAPVFKTTADQTLYDALKASRSELAKTQNVPAYVIFHDKTLVELAQHKPKSLQAMLTISGIGEAKLERYGKPLLSVIIKHSKT
ncbi:DNA helicase RecQ [Ahrensia kielensis]|uniref:DNA helicase RecQ n=1 Tax=Ahrensia kielensis TaxID=76980 RepID=UPI000362C56A|nr:DNA helicase RecQ [Ahrensia kielensis]